MLSKRKGGTLPDTTLFLEMERVMGIEPTLAAWEAAVLPLNYTRRGDKSMLRLLVMQWFTHHQTHSDGG
jgi:hypothetical protein